MQRAAYVQWALFQMQLGHQASRHACHAPLAAMLTLRGRQLALPVLSARTTTRVVPKRSLLAGDAELERIRLQWEQVILRHASCVKQVHIQRLTVHPQKTHVPFAPPAHGVKRAHLTA